MALMTCGRGNVYNRAVANRRRCFDLEGHLQVGHVLQLRVGGQVEVLLGDHDTLLEEVLIHRLSVLLRDEHGCGRDWL